MFYNCKILNYFKSRSKNTVFKRAKSQLPKNFQLLRNFCRICHFFKADHCWSVSAKRNSKLYI